MIKRIVTLQEIRGSAIHRYADDVAWWCRASGQPDTSVNVVLRGSPNSDFERVEIEFPNDSTAENFEGYLESYGVRVSSEAR